MSSLILPDSLTEHRSNFRSDAPFIFVGITAYEGVITTGLAQQLAVWMMRAITSKTFKFTLSFVNHHTPLCSARNILVNKFLNDEEFKPCTHFCLIDDDISPMEDSLEDLFKHHVDVVSPLIFSIKLDEQDLACPAPLVFKYNDEGVLVVNCKLEGLVETENIPGGFFLAKRKVMEKIEKPAFKYGFDEGGEKRRGTDEHFSDVIKKAGFKMYVDTDIVVEQMLKVGGMSFNMAMIKAMSKGMGQELQI